MSPIIQRPEENDSRPASQSDQAGIGAGNGSGNGGNGEAQPQSVPVGFAVAPFDASAIKDEEFEKAAAELAATEKRFPTIDEARAAEVSEAFERSAKLNKMRWVVIVVQLTVALLQLYHQLDNGWTLTDFGHVVWSAIVVLTMLLL